ncbi:hypothetical protein [Altererythrobacter sp. MF3-039]|uniref:hypothetical protein n=1 Tax=Altererythrobacter sp. MF3-039 TaxID=3252901 RepID=UPI00390C8761
MSKTKTPNLPSLPDFTPVPRAKDRSNGWKPEVQRAFIEALADTGSVAHACRKVNRSTNGAYQLRRQDGAQGFAAAWEAALAHGVKRIEDVAMDRALNGVEVPVYSYGKLVGTRRQYNDRLLMFMLRNRAPERFTEGRAKAMNAVDQQTLDKLKKQWRKEWKKEFGIKNASIADVKASIDRKVEEMRIRVLDRERREWEAMSPEALEAFATFMRLRARDLEQADFDDAAQRTRRDADKVPLKIPVPPKGMRIGPKPKKPKPPKTEHSPKDKGWD